MLRPDQDIRHEGRTAPPVLRIAGVRAGYGGQSVLRDAGFTLHAGECAALLGPNGSGKTTLLRTLSGVLTPQAGAIEIQGRPLATLKPRERARMVAVVPQRGQLPQGLTARQMVLVDVSLGVAAGAFSQDKKNNGAGGMGGKIMPQQTGRLKKPGPRRWRAAGSQNFRAASCNGFCWHAPLRRKVRSCCWTNWPQGWTGRAWSICSTCLSAAASQEPACSWPCTTAIWRLCMPRASWGCGMEIWFLTGR